LDTLIFWESQIRMVIKDTVISKTNTEIMYISTHITGYTQVETDEK